MANLRELHQELRRVQDRVFQIKRRQNDELWMASSYSWSHDDWNEWKALNNELEASYEPHSKAWNRLYYARMHERLPREIRDMINAEFWDEDYIKGEEGIEVAMKAEGESMEAYLRRPNRILGISHVVLPEYVGAEAAKESVQMWHQIAAGICPMPRTWLALSDYNLGGNLHTVICKDTFGVGLDPATALRFLNIEVSDTSLVLDHKDSKFKDASSRQDAFNLLLRIKKKFGFKLNFIIYHDCIRLKMWPEILQLLRPIVEVFEREGGHVSVESNYSGNNTDCTDETAGVVTNIKHLVRTYDPATWDHSMKQGLVDYFEEFDDQELRPYHRYYRSEEDTPGSDPNVAAWKRYVGPSGVRGGPRED